MLWHIWIKQKIKDVSLENISRDTDNTDKKLFTPIKKGTRVKILTSKKMLQKLLIALTQVKAGDNSENCCSFFVSTKKNYNNIIIKKYAIA